jgi:hypothetical protein
MLGRVRNLLARGILAVALWSSGCGTAGSGGKHQPSDEGGSGGEADGSGGHPMAGSGGNGGSTGGAAGQGGAGGVPGTAGTGGRTSDAAAPPDEPDGAVADATAAPDSGPIPPTDFDCSKLLGAGPKSQWVYPDGKGKLAYKPLNAGGDHIMDFSQAGYMAGGVPLPEVPAAVTLSPSGGDDTAAIQAALDMVATRPATGAFHGAVALKAGSFQIAGALHFTKSGVVLRGAGSGAGGTELKFTGTPRRVMFVTGAGERVLDSASSVGITDEYVPAGSTTFTVSSAAGFKVGDAVMVGRPVTAQWISLLGMDKLVRNGAMQTWISAGTVIRGERTIAAIAGNKITVDVPIPDSFDGKYVKPPGGSIVKFSYPGRINQIGIEGFRAVGSPRAAGNDFNFIELSAVADMWMRDVVVQDFTSAVVIRDSAKRITVEDVLASHTPVAYFTAAAPSDFNVDGSQILVNRGGSKGGNKIFYYSTSGGVVGPNVILGFTGSGMRSPIQPHQRWATGLLTDSAHLDDGGIEYMNRTTLGSGHGWTMGWGVIWNSSATSIRAEQPAGAANWAIGNQGAMSGNGTFDSHGTPVSPGSLYLAQLCARLGPQAVAAVMK